jgi:hypothetical protein
MEGAMGKKRARPGAGALVGTGGYRPGEALRPSSRDCMRTRNLGPDARQCDRCGARPGVLHVPMRRPGIFCPGHCPVCSGLPAA